MSYAWSICIECSDDICNQSLFRYIYVLQLFCQMNHLTTNTLFEVCKLM